MYDTIYNILSSKFKLIKGDKKNYFYDECGQVVATVDEKSITMFYDYPKCSDEIWNHKGKVVVTFVKDFNVNGKICDMFFIDGLCGTCNDVEVHENYAIDITSNNELYSIPLQQKFNALTSEEKIGNCGNIHSQNGFADFDICGLIHIKNCRITIYKPWENRYINENENHINIVQEKGKKDYTDYNSIYEYYRKKYDWFFTVGYKTAGSDKKRAYVYSKQSQTIDPNAVHKDLEISLTIPEELIDRMFSSNINRSLNSIKLQIIREIKNFIINFKENKCNAAKLNMTDSIDKIISRYNFNQRKVDITKKSKKQKRLSR